MQLAPMMPEHVKCICPTAPYQRVTLNFGMKCNSWFDLRSLDPNDAEDEEGIEAAKDKIHALIEEQEKQGVPTDRIILGGFSQGGALSLYSAFTYPKKLGGVIALSCWLPLHAKFPNAASEASKTTPVIQCHGDQDFVVPIQWGKDSEKIMSTFLDKEKYSFKVYKNLSHSSSPAVLHDVLAFIRENLPK